MTVFDQLRLNADQYRLLTDHYPFRTLTERRLAHTLVNGDLRIDSIDTLVIDSRLRWTYRPGDVLTRSGQTRYNSGTLMLNIPTIAQFADQPFLDNHCFYNGGTETVDGVELLRVDFVAAARINTPDVSGSMYLDPKTFQIRRSVLRLSRIPRRSIRAARHGGRHDLRGSTAVGAGDRGHHVGQSARGQSAARLVDRVHERAADAAQGGIHERQTGRSGANPVIAS